MHGYTVGISAIALEKSSPSLHYTSHRIEIISKLKINTLYSRIFQTNKCQMLIKVNRFINFTNHTKLNDFHLSGKTQEKGSDFKAKLSSCENEEKD